MNYEKCETCKFYKTEQIEIDYEYIYVTRCCNKELYNLVTDCRIDIDKIKGCSLHDLKDIDKYGYGI